MPTLQDRINLMKEFGLPHIVLSEYEAIGGGRLVLKLDDGFNEYKSTGKTKKDRFEGYVRNLNTDETLKIAYDYSELCWNKIEPKEFFIDDGSRLILNLDSFDCHYIYNAFLDETHLFLVPLLKKRGKKMKSEKKKKDKKKGKKKKDD
ncbi:hypothetical protein GOV12_07425 [Candidatus Pacearchaeota archaeon]|nr:hypothetical protein [Candidatus Pacearchaeota archaeon]